MSHRRGGPRPDFSVWRSSTVVVAGYIGVDLWYHQWRAALVIGTAYLLSLGSYAFGWYRRGASD